MKKLTGIFLAATLLAGCASNSNEIAGTPTSPAMYNGLSCNQMQGEMARLNNAVSALSAAQDEKASNDTAMTAVSLILFWPAAFAISGDDGNTQALAQAKGQRDALQQAMLMRGC